MSTNNSLLNPPTTIQVGNDIDDNNHNNIPTEVKTNREQHAASSSSLLYIYNSTAMASPDIDRVIRGFQQELDTLSKSFDLLATSQSQKKRALASSEKSRKNTTTTTHATTPVYRSSVSVPFDPTPTPKRFPTTMSSEPLRFVDPPSRSSRSSPIIGGGKSNRSETISSRSTTKTNHVVGDIPVVPATDETFLSHSTTTRFQEEPRPVDTPMVSSTAGGTRTSRYDDVGIGVGIDIGEDQYNLGKSEIFEGTIKRMKEAMNEQNYTIRQLQRENNDLRRRLLFAQGANTAHDPKTYKGKQQRQRQEQNSSCLEPMFDGSNRLPRNNLDNNNNSNNNNNTRYNNYDRTTTATSTHRPERHYDEMRHMSSSLSTYRSTQLSTPPRDEDENTFETTPRVGTMHTGAGFTPGTKFVAVSSFT
jgi:hypothetical protein